MNEVVYIIVLVACIAHILVYGFGTLICLSDDDEYFVETLYGLEIPWRSMYNSQAALFHLLLAVSWLPLRISEGILWVILFFAGKVRDDLRKARNGSK